MASIPTRRRQTCACALALCLGLGSGGRACGAPKRIGWLSQGSPNSGGFNAEAIHRAFASLGLLQGRDYELHARFAEMRPERLPALAAELAALKPVLIMAPGPSANALLAASDVPVLMMGDPIVAGAAGSARTPGGRVTGVNILFEPLNVKRMELLGELLPPGSRVLVIATPNARRNNLAELEAAAVRMKLELRLAQAESRGELENALAQARRWEVAGINQLNSPVLWGLRQLTYQACREMRIPAIYQWAEAAAEGGLMAYGPRNSLVWQQYIGIAKRVLQGEPPANIPIEEPTHIHLALNLKTASQIGLSFPPALLARADEVVE